MGIELIKMIENILEKIARFVQYINLPKFKKLEHQIGCKLILRNIPDRYINGWVSCDMTRTWKRSGLDVEKGANYFTIGHVLNGESHRFDPNSAEYQSWLGGYTVRLLPGTKWSPEDHFKLAIADQNSWLRYYGDPKPTTTTNGWNLIYKDSLSVDKYIGDLYEFGCNTHDDVGRGYATTSLRLASIWMAASFNISNPNLKLTGKELRPIKSDNLYQKLKLMGHIAIFDISENVKVVLYGNGFIDEAKHVDTFAILKDNILGAMKSCNILEV